MGVGKINCRMGNTDSKLAALYRDQVVRLARPDGEQASTIPLVREQVSLDQLVAAYLNRERNIDADRDLFDSFYVEFISAGNMLTMELVNSLVSPTELHNIISVNPANFVNLLRYTALQVLLLSNSLDTASTTRLETQLVELLVCVRILTKMVPVYLQRRKVQEIFWTRNSNHIFGLASEDPIELPPLGLLLVRALVKLMFIEGFTIATRGAPGSFSHVLWENGISTQDATYHHQTPVIDSNRLEIINLVLAMSSFDLYQPRSFVSEPNKKINKFLFCLTTLTPEYDLICMVASMINLVCRYCSNYPEETSVPYHDLGYKQNHQQHLPALRHTLVLSSLQLLNLMCFNDWDRTETFNFTLSLKLQSPSDVDNLLPNMVLSYLTTFSREFDLRLILTSFARIFKLPVDAAIEQESNPLNFLSKRPSSTTVNEQPNTSNNSEGANETSDNATALPPVSPLVVPWLILFIRLVQINKCFENYVADKIANKLIVFSLYYLNYYNEVPEVSSALIPLCSNLALLLSSKKLVLSKMLDRFTPNYYTNKIPNFFKLSTGNINNITFRDFTLIHLCNIAISDIKNNVGPRPWLFELIYNLLPIPLNLQDNELAQLSSKRQSKTLKYGGLSYNASMTLLQLISKMSSKKYLTTFSAGSLAKSYLTSPGYKLDLLTLTLRAVLVYIYLYFDEALNLVFAVSRHFRVLTQLRDSMEAISKALADNGVIEEVGKIQMHDYVEYVLNPRLLQDDVHFYSNDQANNKGSNESSTQNIFFDKDSKQDKDSEESGDVDDESMSVDELNSREPSSDSNDTEISKVQSNVKSYEVFEQADMAQTSIFSDRTLFNSVRPQWPIGITARSKGKRSATSAFSKSWVGSDILKTLIKAIRLILHNHPSITTITTTDYYMMIEQISKSKDRFKQAIAQSLPVIIREMNEAKPLRIELSEHNFVYQQWLRIVVWTQVFNTHSGPYSISPALTNTNHATNGTNLTRESTVEYSTPTMPHLERWNSNGSTLSRTNSNNSSLLSYFSGQNHEAVPNSPLELSSHHVPSPSMNNKRVKSPSSGGGRSFFRFSWTGFNKDEEYSPINEDEYSNGKPASANNQRRPVYTLDPGVLKPNSWAGTHVRLFKVRRREKEEFSLLDMTSSLLKKLKFSSNPGPNGLEITPTTPVSSRPYTPRDSVSSNHSMFSTPKQL